ncbi:YgjV family protein [Anaerocaecibacter muris]|uniref:YgjV family protein n=1 Tax=Anaerocaecibacter muris TaxID=2941513 RepID=UPI003F68D857
MSTFAYGSTNFALTRVLIFITSTSWFVYNLLVKSYAGCACELLTIGLDYRFAYQIQIEKRNSPLQPADAAATDTTTEARLITITTTATRQIRDRRHNTRRYCDRRNDCPQTAAATTDGQNIIENVTDEQKEN